LEQVVLPRKENAMERKGRKLGWEQFSDYTFQFKSTQSLCLARWNLSVSWNAIYWQILDQVQN